MIGTTNTTPGTNHHDFLGVECVNGSCQDVQCPKCSCPPTGSMGRNGKSSTIKRSRSMAVSKSEVAFRQTPPGSAGHLSASAGCGVKGVGYGHRRRSFDNSDRQMFFDWQVSPKSGSGQWQVFQRQMSDWKAASKSRLSLRTVSETAPLEDEIPSSDHDIGDVGPWHRQQDEEEPPLKVYNAKKIKADRSKKMLRTSQKKPSSSPDLNISAGQKRCSPSAVATYSSCQAIRSAVHSLYNVDDFIMDKIGEGFFSEVFKVVHKSHGRVMVLKRNKHRSTRATMLKEVQLMNTLKHENVLRYEGACVADGQLHALVEYVNGGSLDQLIHSVLPLNHQNQGIAANDGMVGPDGGVGLDLSGWPLRLNIAADVAKGMAYLHGEGIFHRDLTSKNVLVRVSTDTTGCGEEVYVQALVADFGLASKIPKKCSSQTEKLSQVGSPYWMSPECLRGEFYDESSDVFSYGIVLCELIARVKADPDYLPRTANFGVDYMAFSELVQTDCPPEFLQLAFSCVQIKPSSRPDFDSLSDTLDEISLSLNGVTTAVTPTQKTVPAGVNLDEPSLSPCGPPDSSDSNVDSSDESSSCTSTSTATVEVAVKHHSVEDELTTTEKCDSVVPNIQTFVEEPHRDEDDIRRSNSPDSTEDHKKAKDSSQKKNSRHLLQVPRSRRSQTQRIGDVFPKYPPSEYARHHSPLAPRTPLTPAYVGRQMSQRDPHYLPGPPGGTNPFSNLPPHLTEAGKIFTSKDLFSSCFELLNLQGSDWHTSQTVSRPRPYRKAISMVHPPETVKNFQ